MPHFPLGHSPLSDAVPMRTYLGRTLTPREALAAPRRRFIGRMLTPTGRPGLQPTTHTDVVHVRSWRGTLPPSAGYGRNGATASGDDSGTDSDDTSTRATWGDSSDTEDLVLTSVQEYLYMVWWSIRERGQRIPEEVD